MFGEEKELIVPPTNIVSAAFGADEREQCLQLADGVQLAKVGRRVAVQCTAAASYLHLYRSSSPSFLAPSAALFIVFNKRIQPTTL